MREKKRYILVKPVAGDKISLEKGLKRLLGEIGYAEAGIEVEEKGEYLIIRCGREYLYRVRGALALLNRYDVLLVSGCVHRLREFLENKA